MMDPYVIHGLVPDDDYESSSSGLSEFDEEYFRMKPPPLIISKDDIIVIEPSSKPKRSVDEGHENPSSVLHKNVPKNKPTENFVDEYGITNSYIKIDNIFNALKPTGSEFDDDCYNDDSSDLENVDPTAINKIDMEENGFNLKVNPKKKARKRRKVANRMQSEVSELTESFDNHTMTGTFPKIILAKNSQKSIPDVINVSTNSELDDNGYNNESVYSANMNQTVVNTQYVFSERNCIDSKVRKTSVGIQNEIGTHILVQEIEPKNEVLDTPFNAPEVWKNYYKDDSVTNNVEFVTEVKHTEIAQSGRDSKARKRRTKKKRNKIQLSLHDPEYTVEDCESNATTETFRKNRFRLDNNSGNEGFKSHHTTIDPELDHDDYHDYSGYLEIGNQTEVNTQDFLNVGSEMDSKIKGFGIRRDKIQNEIGTFPTEQENVPNSDTSLNVLEIWKNCDNDESVHSKNLEPPVIKTKPNLLAQSDSISKTKKRRIKHKAQLSSLDPKHIFENYRLTQSSVRLGNNSDFEDFKNSTMITFQEVIPANNFYGTDLVDLIPVQSPERLNFKNISKYQSTLQPINREPNISSEMSDYISDVEEIYNIPGLWNQINIPLHNRPYINSLPKKYPSYFELVFKYLYSKRNVFFLGIIVCFFLHRNNKSPRRGILETVDSLRFGNDLLEKHFYRSFNINNLFL